MLNIMNSNKNSLMKRKSCTSLLCEITRLKSQQKYLEGNQVKLIQNQFYDTDGLSAENSDNVDSKHIELINDIEHFKSQLDIALVEYRRQSRIAVNNICNDIKKIREDTRQSNSLDNCLIDALRERIFGINKRIGELRMQNSNDLKKWQSQVEDYEKETDILIT